jgi:ParB-like chromosome segregation protein Spo0J
VNAATPYQVMPALAPDEFEALKADIAARGVQVPVEYDEMGNILDGHHRVQACFDLGITHWPRLVRHGMSEEEKRRHARRLNLDRRHLNSEQKRALIAQELKEHPASSDRAIGSGLNVDHKTVGAVREGLETTGEIPQLEQREGRDKRTRRITQFVPSTPEEERGLQLSAKQLNARNDDAQRQARRDLARDLSDTSAQLTAQRRYPCIYADPAWRRKAGIGDRAYENHFPTMTWDAIMALPVKDLLLPDAWLFLWLPRAHLMALHKVKIDVVVDDGEVLQGEVRLPLAWAIARAWGCDEYSTCFVWTKTDEDHEDEIGTGLVVRDQDEILCLFKKGRGLPKPASDEKFGSNHRERSKPLGHSRKPRFYRDMIATMTGGVPVLELFARADDNFPLPANWETWGNEAPKKTTEAA